jgi:hypothetical protein
VLARRERGLAVCGKLIDMALKAPAAVATFLVGRAELLDIRAAGLAQAGTSAFGARFPASGVGLAAHEGQTEQGNQKSCGFLHGQVSNAPKVNFRRDDGFQDMQTLEQHAGRHKIAGGIGHARARRTQQP